MKNFSFIVTLLVVGYSAMATPQVSAGSGSSYGYGEPFIFIERNVEFAVYPDGQFDFFYNPSGFNASRFNPIVNVSYNAGYFYDPFIQYDDFGAVIQIETVPVYYDFYGRIIQAGKVLINYNDFGRISRIGNLVVHYNSYKQYTHYSGFINGRNLRYIPQPWHRYYKPPYQQYTIVHHQPYRSFYYPERVRYSYHKNYYQKHYNKGYRKSYYRPGDDVVVYHRGKRTERVREIRENRMDISSDYSDVRSNMSSERNRNSRVSVKQPETASKSTPYTEIRNSRINPTSSGTTPIGSTVDRKRPYSGAESDSKEIRFKKTNVQRNNRSNPSDVQRTQTPNRVKSTEAQIRSTGSTSDTASRKNSTSRSSRGRD